MMVFMKTVITNKLVDAKFITLITDIWTNASMIDYLALGASIINTSFIKEILIIGMVKMSGSHNAENIKKAIEIIINKLNFNKAKISAVVTDEGSNLLRLFKQIEDKFFIEASPNEEDDQEEGENNDD